MVCILEMTNSSYCMIESQIKSFCSEKRKLHQHILYVMPFFCKDLVMNDEIRCMVNSNDQPTIQLPDTIIEACFHGTNGS